jgi:hypothetical protein
VTGLFIALKLSSKLPIVRGIFNVHHASQVVCIVVFRQVAVIIFTFFFFCFYLIHNGEYNYGLRFTRSSSNRENDMRFSENIGLCEEKILRCLFTVRLHEHLSHLFHYSPPSVRLRAYITL